MGVPKGLLPVDLTCKRLTVVEKKGLHQVEDILENYGIDSETDVSLLDQDDFRNLTSRGLKPFHVKKLDHWCETVSKRTENMLSLSLNTPSAPALLICETLTVMTGHGTLHTDY